MRDERLVNVIITVLQDFYERKNPSTFFSATKFVNTIPTTKFKTSYLTRVLFVKLKKLLPLERCQCQDRPPGRLIFFRTKNADIVQPVASSVFCELRSSKNVLYNDLMHTLYCSWFRNSIHNVSNTFCYSKPIK